MIAWPVRIQVELPTGVVVLRPLRREDAEVWMRVRAASHDWLRPWEATAPAQAMAINAAAQSGSPSRVRTKRPNSFSEYVRQLNAEAKAGELLPFLVEFNGQFCGQVTVSGIQYGSLWSGSIGYWISKDFAGRGIMPTAVALVTDYCFSQLGLHRIEINIRPENTRSIRVVEKLGFRDEGLRKGYLHIQGRWCDHRSYALVAEDVPAGVFNRWYGTWVNPVG